MKKSSYFTLHSQLFTVSIGYSWSSIWQLHFTTTSKKYKRNCIYLKFLKILITAELFNYFMGVSVRMFVWLVQLSLCLCICFFLRLFYLILVFCLSDLSICLFFYIYFCFFVQFVLFWIFCLSDLSICRVVYIFFSLFSLSYFEFSVCMNRSFFS